MVTPAVENGVRATRWEPTGPRKREKALSMRRSSAVLLARGSKEGQCAHTVEAEKGNLWERGSSMTILDNTGEYARPVEECAKAVSGHLRCSSRTDRGALSERIAVAAIGRLRELGYINDIGLAAIKAEAKHTTQPR